MKDKFYILDENEVISIPQQHQPIIKNSTCTSYEFLQGVRAALYNLSQFNNPNVPVKYNDETPKWFSSNGIEGEALRFSAQNWQTGRLKLALVFCPDEEEEEIEETTSSEMPLLEASLEPIETSTEPLDELRKLADET
jgi:hypothetical protein